MAGTSGTVKADIILPQTSGKGLGIKGVTDGSAATAGDIGEVIESVVTSDFNQASPTLGTFYDATSGTITLTAGHWRIEAGGFLYILQTAGAGKQALPQLAIRVGSTTKTLVGGAIGQVTNATSSPDYVIGSVYATIAENITSSTTYKISIKYQDFGTSAASVTNLQLRATNNYSDTYYIRAIRIR